MTRPTRWIALLALLVGAWALPLSADTLPAEQIFGKSLVKNMKISPDGEHVALTYEEGSEVKLAVMELASQDIVSGFDAGCCHEVIEDRRAAIQNALAMAADGDIVVVAGKGHEGVQELANTVLPFDDHGVINELVNQDA